LGTRTGLDTLRNRPASPRAGLLRARRHEWCIEPLQPARRERVMLTASMIVLGLVTFAAMVGFVTLCDRV
jgi:hypothetical protein